MVTLATGIVDQLGLIRRGKERKRKNVVNTLRKIFYQKISIFQVLAT